MSNPRKASAAAFTLNFQCVSWAIAYYIIPACDLSFRRRPESSIKQHRRRRHLPSVPLCFFNNYIAKHSRLMHNNGIMKKSNIVLIGMPAAGKSTLGVLLAKRLGMSFVDTDLVIQSAEGKTLHELIAQHGMDRFCQLECKHVQQLNLTNTVIATGGSVAYYDCAMQHLKNTGTIVYLHLPLEDIQKRLADLNQRGVVIEPSETLASLYDKRKPLYEKYAEITIELTGLDHDRCVEAILKKLEA